MEQPSIIDLHSFAEAPASMIPNVATPARRDSLQTIHAPHQCSQRHGGNSRQTDIKLPVCMQVARFCHAFRLLSVTCKPRFKCSRKPS